MENNTISPYIDDMRAFAIKKESKVNIAFRRILVYNDFINFENIEGTEKLIKSFVGQRMI